MPPKVGSAPRLLLVIQGCTPIIPRLRLILIHWQVYILHLALMARYLDSRPTGAVSTASTRGRVLKGVDGESTRLRAGQGPGVINCKPPAARSRGNSLQSRP